MAFVDVRRAFPSVLRDILWKKLSAMGASDNLVRALLSLYDGALGSARTSSGLGELFDIALGTREGGVESPLLYVLFVADLIEKLDNVNLADGSALLDGKPVCALQLVDDLALIARSEHDLNLLLEEWSKYCDLNHQETNTKKAEIVVFTFDRDLSLNFQDSELRDRRKKPMEFYYKNKKLKHSEFAIEAHHRRRATASKG